MGAGGMTTCGGGTIFSSLVSLLGFHNEFEDQQGLLSVTQDQVVGWVQGQLGPVGVSAAESQIAQMISEQQSPTVVTPPLPWASSGDGVQ